MKSTQLAAIKTEMESLAIRHTKAVAGVAVTRWTAGKYEVGTWGKAENTFDIDGAVNRLAEMVAA